MNYVNPDSNVAAAEASRELDAERISFARGCLFNVMEVGHRLLEVSAGRTDLPTIILFVEGVLSFCEVTARWDIPTQCARRQRNINVVQCILPEDLWEVSDNSDYFTLLAQVADHSARFAEFLTEMLDWLNTDSGKDAMEDDLPELAYIHEIALRRTRS